MCVVSFGRIFDSCSLMCEKFKFLRQTDRGGGASVVSLRLRLTLFHTYEYCMRYYGTVKSDFLIIQNHRET
jgi:hypothetical protein